jgi:m7GpppX diphosphatase
MITETAEVYHKAILPWIESQPKSRIQWVYNILEGLKEQDNILLRDNDPDTGFIVLPDRYQTMPFFLSSVIFTRIIGTMLFNLIR